MALIYLFKAGEERNIRGFLDLATNEIVFFDDDKGVQLFRIKDSGITNNFKEFIYNSDGILTQTNIWETSAMATKLFQTDFGYANGVLTQTTITRISDNFTYTKTFIYNAEGSLINTETAIV